MSSKLQKIRTEIARFEKEAPYNFCDRWCERCQQSTRDRCSLYQEEFESRLQSIAQGKNPDDDQTTFEMIQDNLEKTNMLLNAMAKKEGIDLSLSSNSASALKRYKERKLYQHPLFKQAVFYSRKVNQFIEQSYARDDESLQELADEYETLIWYHSLLPPKVHRFLCGLFLPDTFLDDTEEGREGKLCDAVAQLEISRKAIDESQKALHNIFALQIRDRYVITDLIEMLQHMNQEVQKILADIDQGAI